MVPLLVFATLALSGTFSGNIPNILSFMKSKKGNTFYFQELLKEVGLNGLTRARAPSPVAEEKSRESGFAKKIQHWL